MTLTVREARADEYEEVARLTVEAYEEYAASLSDESWEHYRSDLADFTEPFSRCLNGAS